MQAYTASIKAPRSKLRGINCAFSSRWLSASIRPKERGIEPAEIKIAYVISMAALKAR
jgi:hypothetical protein